MRICNIQRTRHVLYSKWTKVVKTNSMRPVEHGLQIKKISQQLKKGTVFVTVTLLLRGRTPLHQGCSVFLNLRGMCLKLAQSHYLPGALRTRPHTVHLEKQRCVRHCSSKLYRNQCCLFITGNRKSGVEIKWDFSHQCQFFVIIREHLKSVDLKK